MVGPGKTEQLTTAANSILGISATSTGQNEELVPDAIIAKKGLIKSVTKEGSLVDPSGQLWSMTIGDFAKR